MPFSRAVTFSSPSAAASASLTPGRALSKLVWAAIMAMPERTSAHSSRPSASVSRRFLRPRNSMGWWVTISWQPLRRASSTTSSRRSRAHSTRSTGLSGFPASRPTLSHSSASSKGAMPFTSSSTCATVADMRRPPPKSRSPAPAEPAANHPLKPAHRPGPSLPPSAETRRRARALGACAPAAPARRSAVLDCSLLFPAPPV